MSSNEKVAQSHDLEQNLDAGVRINSRPVEVAAGDFAERAFSIPSSVEHEPDNASIKLAARALDRVSSAQRP
jgi:hypothetical protein